VTRIDVRFNEADHRRVVDRLNELIRNGEDLTPAMRAVSEHLLSVAEESFARETSPDGEAWAPLASSTRRQRRREGKDGPILQRDRHLRRSLDSDAGRGEPAPGRERAGRLRGDRRPPHRHPGEAVPGRGAGRRRRRRWCTCG